MIVDRRMQSKLAEIESCIEQLGSLDSDVQLRAENRLIEIGDSAVGPLMEATRSPKSQVRWRSAYALGQIGDRRAFDSIARLLDDPDGEVVEEAREALGELGDPRAIDVFLGLIGSAKEAEYDAWHSASYLWRFGEAAVPGLLAILDAGSAEARGVAAFVLGEIGDRKAIGPLRTLLSDPIAGNHAAVALGKLGDPSVIDQLIDDLDEDHWSLGGPGHALHQLGRPALQALLRVLQSGSAHSKARAIYALGGIPDEQVIDVLAGLLRSPDQTLVIAAVDSLAEIAEDDAAGLHERAVELIESCLGDEREEIREAAELALSSD